MSESNSQESEGSEYWKKSNLELEFDLNELKYMCRISFNFLCIILIFS